MNAKTVSLDDWAVVYGSQDPYCPPEMCGVVLVGRVTGHPNKPDGVYVQTSNVVGVDGRNISTESGTVYRLGDPSDSYRAWLDENRPQWDPENPIKKIGKAEA